MTDKDGNTVEIVEVKAYQEGDQHNGNDSDQTDRIDYLEDQQQQDELGHEQMQQNDTIVEIEPLDFVVYMIRDISKRGQLVQKADLLQEPFMIKEEEVDGIVEDIISNEKYSDMKKLIGQKSWYIYSTRYVVDHYADLLLKKEEDNTYEMLASTIRRESELYPRPTKAALFRSNPYNLYEQDLLNIIDEMKAFEEYRDIQVTYASNQVMYLYSETYMDKSYAKSLVEWYEIGQYECHC